MNAEIAEIAEKILLRKAVYYPLQTVASQGACVKVEKKTDRTSRETEIREQLN
jgi:hypothetical protein